MSYKEDFYKQCLIIDFETTGKDYKTAEIIETGFCIREDDNWVIFQDLHKPVNKIPPMVESICYITNKMVEDSPSFESSKEIFQSVVDSYVNGYAIGHNYFYDMKVGQNNGVVMPAKSICTWKISKKLFSNLPDIENTTLPYLRFALELDVPIEMRCHRGGNDCFMTGKLLEVLVDLLETSNIIDTTLPYGPQIEAWLEIPTIYETMPFGKHKGELMSAIPHSYWKWAMDKTDWFNQDADNYDPDLAASIHKALGVE